MILIANEVFDKKSKVFINLHVEAKKRNVDEEKLQAAIDSCDPNVKIVFEHLPSDNFENFVNKFKGKIRMTYDTAHIFASGYDIQNLLTLPV